MLIYLHFPSSSYTEFARAFIDGSLHLFKKQKVNLNRIELKARTMQML